MRTSYIAPSTPRSSPHRYYTRNNQNPISPSDNQQKPRENTPPTFLDKRRNLYEYRGDSESSGDELDVQAGRVPEPKSRLKSAANLLRNTLMWIGLSLLTMNVYILSQFKRLWVWKHPFLDTGLNKDAPETSERYRGYGLARSPMPSKLGSNILNRNVMRNTGEQSSEVGWCGFFTSLLFLAALVLILGILLVPSPIQGGAETATISGQIFSYLEEQKHVSNKVAQLEAGLASLDEKTVKSHSELKSSIKDLEKEKERLESQLVAIATLDRQQSGQLDKLQNQQSAQDTRILELSTSLEEVKVNYNSMKTEIERLRGSITTVSDLQTQLSSSQTAESDKVLELSTAVKRVLEETAVLKKQIEKLGAGQTELTAIVNPLSSKQEELFAVYNKLSEAQTATAGIVAGDVEKLKAEILPLIADVKIDDITKTKLEEQGIAMKIYEEKILKLETKISNIPAQQPSTLPADLTTRLDTLSAELEKIQSSSSASSQQYTTLATKLESISGELERYVSTSGKKVQEVWSALQESRHKATEDNRMTVLKLQSVESKLAVITALQDRLGKLDIAQVQGVSEDKRLQSEIMSLIASLRDLDVKYEEKVRLLNLSLTTLNSDKTSDTAKTSEAITNQAEEIKTLKSKLSSDVTSLQQKLVDLENSAEKTIRRVVLEVLSSVTNNVPDTRFFGDWLRAGFLTREQFDREVHNETVVLPSQDQLVQIVISELHSKHSINLHPASGITAADIWVIVKEALQTFDEDKTGRADFALEALGGNVLSIGCTETYYEGAPYASFMSVPLFRLPNPPNVALQPDITPGKCWAFKGNKGYMMIKLAHAVVIDGFSMEHLPRKLSLSNDISSAPNKFSVRGVSHPTDSNSHFFGEFKFSDTGPSLQHFNVVHASKVAYEIVELDIESNHGNPEYTCLYRIRVHGKVPKLS